MVVVGGKEDGVVVVFWIEIDGLIFEATSLTFTQTPGNVGTGTTICCLVPFSNSVVTQLLLSRSSFNLTTI